jgi:hypothetical protein
MSGGKSHNEKDLIVTQAKAALQWDHKYHWLYKKLWGD